MNTSHRNYSDWSMVDHMVCGVGGGVLLYSDLGYMVVDFFGSIGNDRSSLNGRKYNILQITNHFYFA